MPGLGFTHWGALVTIAFGVSFCTVDYASAQITPDGTLPINSNVTPDGSTFNITGGTKAGTNLFHSFNEFSIRNGSTAIFNNALDIQNIISRVTGRSVSEIDGIIRANGTANLFLLNPNGIIFGKNAQLNIGGSFVATTASVIGFGNQGFFSAENPKSSSSLLTVNPSALLFNQIKTASIQNNSVAPSGFNPSSEFIAAGLRVPDGKSLLLVGGDINMDGGRLFAFGGRVDLGGLKGTGTIGLNSYGNNLSSSFPDNVERSDVLLSRGSIVDVAAGNGGSIAVNAHILEIIGGSGLLAGIDRGLDSNNSKAGNIDLNATGVINVNNSSFINNRMFVEARGQAGNININTETLVVKDGGQVSASTWGRSDGGNLNVDAQNVQIIGTSAADGEISSGLFASARRNSTGDAGDLTIKTNNLLIKNGAQVFTGTSGGGKGGNLAVDAQDVQLIGRSADGRLSSGLFADTRQNSTGDAGDLIIKTNTLLIKDGAVVSANTLGRGKGGNLTVDAQDVQLIGRSADGRLGSGLFADTRQNSTGDAGDLTIKTNTLLVRDGAQVGAGTFGAGNGGNLTVDAQDVKVISRSNDNQFPSGLFVDTQQNSTGNAGNLTIKTNTLLVRDGAQVGAGTLGAGNGGNLTVDAQDVQVIGRSNDNQFSGGLFASTTRNSPGNAGDLTVETNTLLVQDGAEINVQSSGIGTAGTMTLNARSIRLNNNAVLSGNTQSARFDPGREQATININSESLIMSRNSNIRTNATGKDVIGGNINIDTDLLIASGNSDIRADSVNFRGGNVFINAQGIFGIQFRDMESNSTSDITATGASSDLSGSVELNTPGIDPNSGLVELPTVPVDTQVAQGCYSPGYAQNRFVITGRGGLPANPKDILTPDAPQIDWVSFKPSNNNRSLPPVTSKPTTSTPKRIVEATGAVLNAKGQIVLIANSSNATFHTSRNNPIQCNVR